MLKEYMGDECLKIGNNVFIHEAVNVPDDLEIGDNSYTKKFGGHSVTKSEVLSVVEGNPKATIITDLTCADLIPSDTFDCIICTQTIQMIYDMKAALHHLHRILKPGVKTFPATCGGGWFPKQ